jgi:hypothetical protein
MKYYIIDKKETKIVTIGDKSFRVYRLVADSNFQGGPKWITAGTKGGWVESTKNISPLGRCWISDEAVVVGNAKIRENASVWDNVVVSDSADLYENFMATGSAQLFGSFKGRGDASATENSQGYGTAEMFGWAKLTGMQQAMGVMKLFDNSKAPRDGVAYFSPGYFKGVDQHTWNGDYGDTNDKHLWAAGLVFLTFEEALTKAKEIYAEFEKITLAHLFAKHAKKA